MERDSAIVIFCSVVLVAVLLWKAEPYVTAARIVTPEPETPERPVTVNGPGMVRPAFMAAQPYGLGFLPPAFVYVEDREDKS